MRDPEKHTYQIGNTTIHVVAPEVSKEERQQRLEEIKRIIWVMWNDVHKT